MKPMDLSLGRPRSRSNHLVSLCLMRLTGSGFWCCLMCRETVFCNSRLTFFWMCGSLGSLWPTISLTANSMLMPMPFSSTAFFTKAAGKELSYHAAQLQALVACSGRCLRAAKDVFIHVMDLMFCALPAAYNYHVYKECGAWRLSLSLPVTGRIDFDRTAL